MARKRSLRRPPPSVGPLGLARCSSRRVVVVHARDPGRAGIGRSTSAVLARGTRRRRRGLAVSDPATLPGSARASTSPSADMFRSRTRPRRSLPRAPRTRRLPHRRGDLERAPDRVALRNALDPRRARLAGVRRRRHLAPVVSGVRIGDVHAAPRPARRSRVALARPSVVSGGVDRTRDPFSLPVADASSGSPQRDASRPRPRPRCSRRDHARRVGGDRVPGFAEYPELARKLADAFGRRAVARGARAHLGLSRPAVGSALRGRGSVVARVCGAGPARRGRADDVSVALVASLALMPIVWLHYSAFLIVPLALARPRLSWARALLWPFWLLQHGTLPGRVEERPRDR